MESDAAGSAFWMATRNGRLALCVLTCASLFALAATPPTAVALPDAPTPPREGTGSQITSFYFAKNSQISPVAPFNESRGQTADALGVTFPRALVSNVGTWSVTLSEEGMIVDGLDGLSIWASSENNAQNVRFTINVELNGNSAGQLNTETKGSLQSSPEEFRIDAGSSRLSSTVFPKGSQLSFNLQYRATSSLGPVGPSGSSTFHYYSDLHRSRVDIVTNPFNLTLAEWKIVGHHLNITEIVKDAFSVDPAQKLYFVTLAGPSSSVDRFVHHVDTRFDPINGTTLIWDWNFGAQGGVTSGAYAVQLSAQYIGSDSNYTNVTSADIDFPQVNGPGGGIGGGFDLVLFGSVGVAAVGGAVFFLQRRAARGK